MQNNILSLLGLCRRAGKLVMGHDPVIKAIKENKAQLTLFASDYSENSKKEIKKVCEENNAALLTLPFTKEELGVCVGHYCGAVAVTDRGFSDKLRELILSYR